jgi:hypothetical protein
VAIDGGTALLASDPFGLSAAQIADPRAPAVAGAANLPFLGEHVAAHGGRAVVTGQDADGRAHLWTLDVSDPAAPRILGELATAIPAGAVSGFLDVALDAGGTRAVTAMGTAGLWVVDLSVPSAPVVRGTYDTPGTAYAVALDATATLAYVADANRGLAIVSLANPSAPALAGTLALSGIQRDVTVTGGVAYLADQVGRLVTVDVSAPAAPRQLGAFVLGRYAFHVAAEGTLAVVLDGDTASDYLDVIDVAAPATPARLTAVTVAALGTTKGIAFSDGLVYAAMGSKGLAIYDVASSSAVGDVSDTFMPGGIALASGRAVVAGTDMPTNTACLKVVDTTDPTAPRVVGTLATATPVGAVSGILDVALAPTGALAVAAAGTQGLWTIDLTNPGAPAVRGAYDTPGTAYGIALDAATALAYVADGNRGLQIVSVANPSAPALVGSLALSGIARAVIVAAGRAYVADQVGRLTIVDVSTPAAPRLLASFVLGRYAFHVALDGARAVVLDSDSGSDYLDVIDVATPSAPARLGAIGLGPIGTAKGLAVAAGRAYVAAGASGLAIYDLATPAAPALVGTGLTAGRALDVAVSDTAACVADTPATISIVDLFATP